MQDNNLFEYAVIRAMPRVEREEFINVGIIIFCKRKKYLKVLYTVNEDKLLTLFSQLDLAEFSAHLAAYKSIAQSEDGSGPIGKLEISERFRWLTATRSTILQSSKVHPGLSKDLDKSLEKLFNEQVL